MVVHLGELHFEVAYFIGLVNGTAKTKLAVLVLFNCAEFLKTPIV